MAMTIGIRANLQILIFQRENKDSSVAEDQPWRVWVIGQIDSRLTPALKGRTQIGTTSLFATTKEEGGAQVNMDTLALHVMADIVQQIFHLWSS
jgi:hypothetical protein